LDLEGGELILRAVLIDILLLNEEAEIRSVCKQAMVETHHDCTDEFDQGVSPLIYSPPIEGASFLINAYCYLVWSLSPIIH
jgi:hypothetical protein